MGLRQMFPTQMTRIRLNMNQLRFPIHCERRGTGSIMTRDIAQLCAVLYRPPGRARVTFPSMMTALRFASVSSAGMAFLLLLSPLSAQGQPPGPPPLPPGLNNHDRALPPGRPFDGGGFMPPGRSGNVPPGPRTSFADWTAPGMAASNPHGYGAGASARSGSAAPGNPGHGARAEKPGPQPSGSGWVIRSATSAPR
jgi:hypothetical protein